MLSLKLGLSITSESALLSTPAITAYVLIILGSVIALVISLMVKESKAVNSGTVKLSISKGDATVNDGEEAEENGERFCMLMDIERGKESIRKSGYDESMTLRRFL